METETNPKVFISYTHDSVDHIDKILEFSNRLRSEGIDSVIDQYEESPPEGWPKWMDRQIHDADYVLMVCTPAYYKRVMGYEEKGKGLGAIWEGHLIYQHLYINGTVNTKFIPLITKNSSIQDIPTPLQSYTYYQLDSEIDFEKLYWRLRGIKRTEKPQLGKLRPLPPKERKSLFITSLIDIELWDKAKWSGVAFIHTRDFSSPSYLVLLFTDREAAIKIFKQWTSSLGEFDKNNELRISFIEGDVPEEDSFGYYVNIGSNITNIIKAREEGGVLDPNNDLMLTINRFHRMNPSPESKNLEVFKEMYNRFGSYYLLPGLYNSNTGQLHVIEDSSLKLLKRDIIFRHVKDIKSQHDPDAIVLPKYRDVDFKPR